jgi:hypothetical protein
MFNVRAKITMGVGYYGYEVCNSRKIVVSFLGMYSSRAKVLIGFVMVYDSRQIIMSYAGMYNGCSVGYYGLLT